jgi:septal ring factor EnvC (AmiA/AmiB activator)
MAQSKQDLAKKRQRLLTEIDQASKLLSLAKKEKTLALNQYYAVQEQVKQRQQLIETLQEEIVWSDKSIDRTTQSIDALEADLQILKVEFSERLRKAFRNKIINNNWVFLLSAEGLSDGLKRWRYLQQYDEYRKKQANLIIETEVTLKEKLNTLEIKKEEQEVLLVESKEQKSILEAELQFKNSLLKDLSSNETRISRLISQKRKAHRRLSAAIERIITDEIRSRTDASKINTAPSKKKEVAENKATKPTTGAEIIRYSGDFRSQKGKLDWPVQQGIIIRKFGKQAHPIHKRVVMTNNGLDIRATLNSQVKAIYEGEVAGVQYVPGYQNTLIIQHGNYYSVYSNLEMVNVKKGDPIRTRQIIGLAGAGTHDDFMEVHLEIWKGKQRLNPKLWLKARP